MPIIHPDVLFFISHQSREEDFSGAWFFHLTCLSSCMHCFCGGQTESRWREEKILFVHPNISYWTVDQTELRVWAGGVLRNLSLVRYFLWFKLLILGCWTVYIFKLICYNSCQNILSFLYSRRSKTNLIRLAEIGDFLQLSLHSTVTLHLIKIFVSEFSVGPTNVLRDRGLICPWLDTLLLPRYWYRELSFFQKK